MSSRVLKNVNYNVTLYVKDHCLCLHTQRAARALARRFDEAFRHLDVKSGQFSILMALNRPEPPTLGSVSDLLGMDRTTLTANLKPLERRGLLTVAPDPKDRRARRLKLTDAGLKVLEQAAPIWTRTHAEIEAGLENPDAGTLRLGLDRLRDRAGEAAPNAV